MVYAALGGWFGAGVPGFAVASTFGEADAG